MVGAALVAEGEALGQLAEEIPHLVRVVACEGLADGVVDRLDGVAVVEIGGGVGVDEQMSVDLLDGVQPCHPLQVVVLEAVHVGLLSAVEQPGRLEGGGARTVPRVWWSAGGRGGAPGPGGPPRTPASGGWRRGARRPFEGPWGAPTN